MITLIVYYRLWLIVAFLIGVATAWWVWGRAPRIDDPREWEQSDLPSASASASAAAAIAPDRPEAKPDDGEASAQPEPDGDDLTQIKGIDTETASMLNLLGIRRYGEIADWTDMEAEQMTVLLGAGAGRIAENKWVEQARLLASGNRVEFELRFGHL